MNEPSVKTACPDPETLGAFIDGALTGQPLREMTEHLATCDDCMDVLRDPHPEAIEEAPPSRRPWLAIAAALVVLVAIGVIALRFQPRNGMATLVAAAPPSYRTVEPRLSGFRWAELRRLRDSGPAAPDPAALKLAGAVGEVLQRADEERHAAGVASLLIAQPATAIEHLRAATEREPNDAGAWSDLAAAYYANAVEGRRPGDLPLALSAADRAVALEPRHAEGRFNRALILERMGLRAEAQAAWREYLSIDPSSGWAAEARAHLQALDAPPRSSFRQRLQELDAAAARGDSAAVAAIVHAHPQDARKWFETEVLGVWGESAGPPPVAARFVGAALRNNDSLLADAIAAIDARPGPLAAAHARYRRGRLAYRDQQLGAAEAELIAAADAFEQNGSPMANVARLYAASVRFDDERIDEAMAMVGDVLRVAAQTHTSLIAEGRMLRGRCAMYEGRWSDAISDYTAAAETFRRLGESANLAVAEGSLGAAYADVGEREAAWEHRLNAFRSLGAADGQRRVAALAAAARGELRDGRYDAAQALLQLEIGAARETGNPLLIADAFRRRAMSRAQTGDEAGGGADLREARALLARTPDSGLRKSVESSCLLAEGVLTRESDAVRSVALLGQSIAFLEAAGEQRGLAEALLERARSHRARGDANAALADFEAGLGELERQRRGAAESAIFDTATSLFEETVELLVARGDAEGAFARAERVMARSLGLEPATAEIVMRAVPAGTMVVDYVLVPRGIAAFCVTSRGIDVITVPVERATLRAAIRRLRDDIDRRADTRSSATALHALLIESLPVANATSLVIVADRLLQTIPWPALFDRVHGQYLVERHELTLAPSAAVWMRSRSRSKQSDADRLLLVTNDTRAGLDVLDHLRFESSDVAALYANREVLAGLDATPPRFIARANDADVIHFAGHARASEAKPGQAALLLTTELSAAEIARLRLDRPRLAVLAGCSTMAGDASRIDGMPGLARAFLAAGVPGVVGTLWPVDDAHAARLFTEFHRALRRGASNPAALRAAQRSMIESGGPSAHPAAWAAAELLGG